MSLLLTEHQRAWPQSFRLAACLSILIGAAADGTAADSALSFSRDVQPVLARNCFACHGPDEADRQADLRLDVRASAIESGAIVPGKPDESELVRRIRSTESYEQMPPPDSHKSLTDAEKSLIEQWVAAGAEYTPHYAFLPPRRAALPDISNDHWCRNPIDRFILARLDAAGQSPSDPADRYTLIRRVSLDLIGLPPTVAEADAFVHSTDPLAYDKLVDRLLASPAYGERWARAWLDLARYADTNGYEKDRPRSVWLFRDWVIEALNADMPYDQFTVEQLAGDMLPHPTIAQQIATGFHRNTMLNEEGGIDPLEFRFYAMVDRVATTGTVWMGLTTGCAQCHTHKYDPITHTEYYELMALLNNADEPNLVDHDPRVAAERAEIQSRITSLEDRLPEQFPADDGPGTEEERRLRHFQSRFAGWMQEQRETSAHWTVLEPSEMTTNLPRLEQLPDGSIFSTGDITKRDVFTLTIPLDGFQQPITALRLEVLPDDRLPGRGPGRCYYEGRQGDFFLSEVTATHAGHAVRFADASADYGKISVGSGSAEATNVLDGNGASGWAVAGEEGEAHQLVLNLAQPLPPRGNLVLEMLFERHFAASLGRFRLSATTKQSPVRASPLPVAVEALLLRDSASLTESDRHQLERAFSRLAPELSEARKEIDALRKSMPEFPTTLVFDERPDDHPRPTHRHHRGEYLSPKEAVSGGIPEVFESLSNKEPSNRLEFARWLASEENPLVARVAVNRAWRAFFGTGLVRTSGDYGTQSEPPSHPELLDWLACEFIEQGWSPKKLHRLIVTSNTYLQSSRITPEQSRRDPDNRLLARGPRYRLEAELIRDSLLHASGLLSGKMLGESVYPPQPESVVALAYGSPDWPVSAGEDRYRRSLYTFSKRTAPFAGYAVFDAPSGETCIARRGRSNTPLQALTLLNDEMFLEMARALARESLQQELSAGERASWIFRRVLTRPPTDAELTAILDYFEQQQSRIASGELDAAAIVGQPDSAKDDLGSWILVARAVMNLDEAITKN